MMKKSILIYLLVVCAMHGYAQKVAWETEYQKGKQFYKEGKHALAMEVFKPLIEESEEHAYEPYASFYYALAAYHENYLPLAKDMLLQLKTRYRNWQQLDEANFWLAHIYFDQKQYYQALNALKEIRGDEWKEDIAGLKYEYFSQIEEAGLLQQLYMDNEDDEVLGKLLAKHIASQSLVNQDQKLLAEIIERFELNPASYNVMDVQKSEFKDEYKVAVLLPFMNDDLEPNLKRKVNQFVIDLYNGIKLAADTLKAQGKHIRLYAYDTKRSARVTKEIVEQEEMKGMDMIIGPLYAQPIAIVNEFSFQNKINVINPLSSNADVIGDNPFAFMFYPSNEAIGRASARYAAAHTNAKPAIVFYEENENDSAMAYAYKQRIEQDSIKVIAMRGMRKDETRQILDMLLIANQKVTSSTDSAAREAYTIKLDSIGHIFVASNNDLISSKVLSAVETRGDSIVVIGSADWMNLPVIKYDTYQKLGVVLYAPNYFDKLTRNYGDFRRRYVLKHKVIPTKYAEIGYELMYLMGNSLDKYGKYMQVGWRKEGYMPGFLTDGIDYSGSNDNLRIPILHFDNHGMNIIVHDYNAQ